MKTLRVGRSATAALAAAVMVVGVAIPAQAAFRATGEISGMLCSVEGTDCAPVDFEDAKVQGRFKLAVGAVFDAVTNRDPGTGLCRIDLGDTKLADASKNMANLLRAKFTVNSHDGPQEVELNTLEFACVEE